MLNNVTEGKIILVENPREKSRSHDFLFYTVWKAAAVILQSYLTLIGLKVKEGALD